MKWHKENNDKKNKEINIRVIRFLANDNGCANHAYINFIRSSWGILMSDFYGEYMKRQNKRNKFERKCDEYNHTMEFIRTIVPVVVVVLQIIILVRIF